MNKTHPHTTRNRSLAAALLAAMMAASLPMQAATLSWDADAAFNNGALGGTGTWNANIFNLVWDDGTADAAWATNTIAGDTALFAGTAGTVTLGAAINALGLQFTTTGYTVATGANTLTLGTGGIDASSLTSGATTISGLVSLGANQSWNVGTGAALATSAVISGANSLTKTGAGTLTLSGINTFSGGLTISAGTLSYAANTALGGTGGTTGTVSLNGGTLKWTGAGVTNSHVITIGASGGTINQVGTGTYILGNANNLIGSGALTITGNGTLASAGSISAGVVVFGNSNTYNGNVTIQDGGVAEYANASGIDTGGTFTIGNLGMLSANQVTVARDITINSGGTLAFQNANTGIFSGNITLNGNAIVRLQDWWAVTARSGIISGPMSGTGGLTVNSGTGSGGTLTLSGTNTYTGATTISASTLQIGNGGTTGSLSTSSIITNNGTLTFNRSDTVTQGTEFSGSAITGTGAVTKAGTGTLILNAANTYSGATTVSAGTLQLNNANAVQNSTLTINSANGVAFNSGVGTFNLGGLAGSAAQSLTDTGSNAVTLNVGSNNANTTYTGVLSGSGGITKNGTGTLTLNAGAAQTYTGATIVNAGTLITANNNALNTIASSDVTVNQGATFQVGGGNSATTGTIFTAAKSVALNGGALTTLGQWRAQNIRFTNDLTIGAGSSSVSVQGTNSGGFGQAMTFLGTLNRTAGSGGTILFRGYNMGVSSNYNNNASGTPHDFFFGTAPTMVGGGGAINTTTTSIIPYAIGDKGGQNTGVYVATGLGSDFVSYNPSGGTGAGIQILTTYAATIASGASNFNNTKITDTAATGINAATSINSLILNSATAAAGSPGTTSLDGTGTLTVSSGALMVTTTSAAVSIGNNGGLFQNNATIGASGLTLGFGSAEAIITTVGTSTLTIASTSGGITGTGGLTKSGAGTLNLNAANVVSGTTTINAGSVVLGHANALQNSTLNYNNQGGSLSFGTLTAATLGSLKGSQNLALANTTPAAVALTVGNNNATNDTYSGVLSGSGLLTKIGTGTQTLAGVNTYTGVTAVNNGTLALASSGSLASTVYTIGNGGTFNASAKSTYSLASVATTFDVGATTAGFFNGPSGVLTFGNTLTLNFLTASIANGQTYNLLDFGSQTGDFGSVILTGSVVGSLLLTSTDTWTGSNIGGYDITFNEDTGTLLMNVSAIPEPATYAALFGTAALVYSVIRRRRTKTTI